jgi:hypothetical protein
LKAGSYSLRVEGEEPELSSRLWNQGAVQLQLTLAIAGRGDHQRRKTLRLSIPILYTGNFGALGWDKHIGLLTTL